MSAKIDYPKFMRILKARILTAYHDIQCVYGMVFK